MPDLDGDESVVLNLFGDKHLYIRVRIVPCCLETFCNGNTIQTVCCMHVAGCPVNWFLHNAHCYHFVAEPQIVYYEAEAACWVSYVI